MTENEKRIIEESTEKMFKEDINDVEAIAYLLECIRTMCKVEIERSNSIIFGYPSYWNMGLNACLEGLKGVKNEVKSFIKS